jgi:Leucine-rich repeat (LRR) protein
MVANEAEGRPEALQRIAACRTVRAEELDLGGLQLSVLDHEILQPLCELTWLRRLLLGLCGEVREERRPSLAGRERLKVRNNLRVLPDALFDALTRLEELDLAHNVLEGLPSSIIGLGALSILDLSHNKIRPEGVQALKSFTTLTDLDLAGNYIGDAATQALKGLTALTRLNLDYNRIEAEGAQALKGLTALTSLSLTGNKIRAYGAQALNGPFAALGQIGATRRCPAFRWCNLALARNRPRASTPVGSSAFIVPLL